MITTYMSAVYASVIVAGMTTFAMMDTEKVPVQAMESQAIAQMHHYAKTKAAYQHKPIGGSSAGYEIDLGPYFNAGKGRSFVFNDYKYGNASKRSVYYITWYQPRSPEDAERILARMEVSEEDGVGIYKRNGSIGGKVVPKFGVTIPPGSVVVMTKVSGT